MVKICYFGGATKWIRKSSLPISSWLPHIVAWENQEEAIDSMNFTIDMAKNKK